MLGFHNILFISQPSSSHPPPSITSSDHPYPHNDNRNVPQTYNTNNDHLSESSFWSLQKKSKDGGGGGGDDDDDNDNNDGDGSLRACRDCGNRAKKECSFRRCRTCCKTRGFDCASHVRSTWVPASKRREKKLATPGAASASASCSSYGVKRPRPFVVPSPSSHNVTTPATSSSSANDLSLGISSHPQDSRFKKSLPGRIQAPAVFRNIRLTDVSDGEAENAYVATVNISGHVFKGLLYDHGSDKNAFPCVTELQIQTSTSRRYRDSSNMQMETSTSGRYRDSSSPIVDPSNAYTGASGN
nr:SRS6 [Litchi chinensis]